jgi:RNA polymerase sigma factor (sigma-70 family)
MSSEANQQRFFVELDAHRRILSKVARSYCRLPADREDLVQEIVVQLWRSYSRFDGRSKFSTWMYKVALNVAISYHRSEVTRTLSESALKGARTALRNQTILAVVNAMSTWVVIPLMGLFIAQNRTEASLAMAGAIIAAYFAAQLIAQIRQVRALALIDYAEPVATIQRKIETVAKMRIQLVRWIAMTVALLWVPVSMVMAKFFWGINLWVVAPKWLAVNVLFGVLWMAALYLWSKRNAVRDDSTRVQRLVRDISGDNLGSTASFLSTLAQFEKEATQA